MQHPIRFLRSVGLIEAISFLILVGIAMPLKYWAGMPMAVKVVGWVHGILFMVYVLALIRASWVARWPITRGLLLFVAALLPFGPFLVDGKMKGYIREYDGMPLREM